MIIVTGGAGFIGSAFVWKLNREGIEDIIIVDRLGSTDKWKNLVNLRYADYLHRDAFLKMATEDAVPFKADALIHMGACSSTTERDADFLWTNNFSYTRTMSAWAMKQSIRFIYASSAATYGNGSQGFSDDHAKIPGLKPINMYGYSKQVFDVWSLKHKQENKMAGIKFFNVFGPNEYHKGDMTSVIFKAFHQIRQTGKVRLFKSYLPEYGDGGQMRDFVYVKDCVDAMWWLLQNPAANGIFNLGTGKARTWNDLIHAVFAAMNIKPNIEYIEMPEGLRNQYQYFTQAEMGKLKTAGCPVNFSPLEDSVRDYVVNYLQQADPHLGN
ncbi:MAG TPA: ADP-glyceromanno-heptose 6-epimerase [Smithellaceae bacterium]|jgi:ADP-L-glycero-D-manno-heptose 6-epimerase|nr:ADP-glyceromanno-heptose 6-epimerase [Smithellaceae bacterium]HOG81605.1 ADP-glyceromanno-heptose 6-epimerase [Smithellaceae bacterium]HOQ41715.1 ADP-glyceromanno-heptose 6-epimerase [Smithellaceae bacterium]HPL66192.1 ADP-glyceromanno-heptose 6-epimerase [Smithellaceae bacterium]HQP25764.1 ADP-glyceromanno-heptose 6-epimerase [Smithellaceae bacterium]